MTVNVDSIERITRGEGDFGMVHVGLDKFKTHFPYDALLNLLAIDAPERGIGPDPTATAMTY